MKEEVSSIISFLRFPLAIMVVFIHSFGYGVCDINGISLSTFSLLNVYDIIRVLITQSICQVAVPTFFLMSGYLFYQKLQTWNWGIWYDKLKRRFYTLFIPYFVWCVIRYIYDMVTINAISLRHGGTWNDVQDYIVSHTSVMMFYYDKITGDLATPIHTPFWFIRDLIFMILLSPIIYRLINKKNVSTLYIGLLVLLFLLNLFPLIPGVHIKAILFFSLGGWFALGGGKLLMRLINYQLFKFLTFVLMICLLCAMVVYYPDIDTRTALKPFFISCGMIITWYTGIYFAKNKCYSFPRLLTDSCFFIFAFHMFVLISKGLFMDLFDIPKPETPLSLILWYFLNPTIAVACSVFIFYFLKRYAPRLCYMLTGQK